MASKFKKLQAWSTIAVRLALRPLSPRFHITDFTFLSDRETVEHLKQKNIGIVRYGDGELNFTVGYPAIHQKQDRTLRKKLTSILRRYREPQTHLVALPLDLLLTHNYAERNSSPEHWRAPKYAVLPFLKKNAVYGSPFCFRLQDVIDDNLKEYKKLVLSLFDGKDIIYVGKNQNKEQNFGNAISPVQYIPIPNRDAFGKYRQILEQIKEVSKNVSNPVVLISGGVTATALSAELNDQGILTYDIGSLPGNINN